MAVSHDDSWLMKSHHLAESWIKLFADLLKGRFLVVQVAEQIIDCCLQLIHRSLRKLGSGIGCFKFFESFVNLKNKNKINNLNYKWYIGSSRWLMWNSSSIKIELDLFLGWEAVWLSRLTRISKPSSFSIFCCIKIFISFARSWVS